MHPYLAALMQLGLLNVQRPPHYAPVYQTYPALQQLVAQQLHGPYTIESFPLRRVEPIRAPLPQLEDVSSVIRY